MTAYYLLETRRGPRDCSIYVLPDDMPAPSCPSRGEPMAQWYGEAVAFDMAPEVPGFQVPDLVSNALGYLIVSEAARAVLAACSPRIEFLPIVLRNHKGRPVPAALHIANVLDVHDAADPAGTRGRRDYFHEGEWAKLTELALFPERLADAPPIFRLATCRPAILVSEAVRERMTAAKLTGAAFHPAHGFRRGQSH